jgi:hypothetical protein
MAYLNEISSIKLVESPGARIQLHLSRAGVGEPVILTFNYLDEAESFADLIDGYHRLINNSDRSIWLLAANSGSAGHAHTQQAHAPRGHNNQHHHQFQQQHVVPVSVREARSRQAATTSTTVNLMQRSWHGSYESFSRDSHDYGTAAELIDDEGDYSVPAGWYILLFSELSKTNRYITVQPFFFIYASRLSIVFFFIMW